MATSIEKMRNRQLEAKLVDAAKKVVVPVAPPKAVAATDIQPVPEKSRLPDGAEFHMVYFNGNERWRGTLTVDGQVFTGEAKALFTLCSKLDGFYRRWKGAKNGDHNQ